MKKGSISQVTQVHTPRKLRWFLTETQWSLWVSTQLSAADQRLRGGTEVPPPPPQLSDSGLSPGIAKASAASLVLPTRCCDRKTCRHYQRSVRHSLHLYLYSEHRLQPNTWVHSRETGSKPNTSVHSRETEGRGHRSSLVPLLGLGNLEGRPMSWLILDCSLTAFWAHSPAHSTREL